MLFVAADENDDPAVKAAAGMALGAPEVDYDGPVIQVPLGMCRFCSGCGYAALQNEIREGIHPKSNVPWKMK